MKFEEAFEAMRNGKTVRRKPWKYDYIEIDKTTNRFMITTFITSKYPYELSPSALLADDWEIIE